MLALIALAMKNKKPRKVPLTKSAGDLVERNAEIGVELQTQQPSLDDIEHAFLPGRPRFAVIAHLREAYPFIYCRF